MSWLFLVLPQKHFFIFSAFSSHKRLSIKVVTTFSPMSSTVLNSVTHTVEVGRRYQSSVKILIGKGQLIQNTPLVSSFWKTISFLFNLFFEARARDILIECSKPRCTILLHLVLITLLVRWGQIYGKLASAQ